MPCEATTGECWMVQGVGTVMGCCSSTAFLQVLHAVLSSAAAVPASWVEGVLQAHQHCSGVWWQLIVLHSCNTSTCNVRISCSAASAQPQNNACIRDVNCYCAVLMLCPAPAASPLRSAPPCGSTTQKRTTFLRRQRPHQRLWPTALATCSWCASCWSG